MTPTYDIAIVGGGASGALVATQLARQSCAALRIALIEPRPTPGQGAAYSAPSTHLLLNVPAARMSAFPDKPAHFHEWLNSHLVQKSYPDEFVARRLYGYYLEDTLKKALSSAVPGFYCDHLHAEALDISRGKKATIRLSEGRTINADKVVLAIGNLPGEYPIRKALPFYHSWRYIHRPWKPGILENIKPDDSVLLIGAGLTSVDVAIMLLNSKHKGPIHALSRRGILPHVHAPVKPWMPSWLSSSNEWPATIPSWFRRLRKEIQYATNEGPDWRAVIDSLRPHTQQIWQELPLHERRRFFRHVRPYWEIHRHRIPPQVHQQVQEALRSGRLSLHDGRLQTFIEHEENIHALFRGRRGETTQLNVQHVINCTGPRPDITKFQHPLLISLLAQSLIYHDPLEVGLSATPQGEILSFDGKASDWLFTLGPPLKGVLWESSAIPEIRSQAENLAHHLLSPFDPTLETQSPEP